LSQLKSTVILLAAWRTSFWVSTILPGSAFPPSSPDIRLRIQRQYVVNPDRSADRRFRVRIYSRLSTRSAHGCRRRIPGHRWARAVRSEVQRFERNACIHVRAWRRVRGTRVVKSRWSTRLRAGVRTWLARRLRTAEKRFERRNGRSSALAAQKELSVLSEKRVSGGGRRCGGRDAIFSGWRLCGGPTCREDVAGVSERTPESGARTDGRQYDAPPIGRKPVPTAHRAGHWRRWRRRPGGQRSGRDRRLRPPKPPGRSRSSSCPFARYCARARARTRIMRSELHPSQQNYLGYRLVLHPAYYTR